MQTVICPVNPGQGSVPSCTYAPLQLLIPPEPAEPAKPVESGKPAEPAEDEASQAEERPSLGALAPAEAATSLLLDRGHPVFQPHPHFAVTPRADESLEEVILRSFTRRAVRAVRPLILGVPQQELWVVAFDERCLLVGAERLAMAVEGKPLAAPLSMLGWAEAKGARAVVLVQNQPGPRHAATPLALLPTLTLASAAHLHGIILVDHIIVHGGGATTPLRRRGVFAETQAFAVQLKTDLADLAAGHLGVGLPRSAEAQER